MGEVRILGEVQYWEILWQLIEDDGKESLDSNYLLFPLSLVRFSLGDSNIGILIICGPSIHPVVGLNVWGHQAEVLPDMKPDIINYFF